jgi:hypothetical protein
VKRKWRLKNNELCSQEYKKGRGWRQEKENHREFTIAGPDCFGEKGSRRRAKEAL